MNRHLKATIGLAGTLITVALTLGIPARTTAAQTTGPVDVVNAFIAAVNSHDEARIRQLMAPDFKDLEDPGWPDADVVSADEFVQQVIGGGIICTISKTEQTGPQSVVINDTLTFTSSGADVPPLPHPFTETTTITVANGQVTQLSELLSAQTRQDLAASAPPTTPGMPTTGAPDALDSSAPLLLALGALMLGSGLWLGRATRRKI